MPLDNARPLDVKTLLIDPLEALGVVPIPDDFVAAYKSNYMLAYLRDRVTRPPCEWETISFSTWKTFPRRKKVSFADFLANPTSTRYTNDQSGAPEELIKLAQHVRTALPRAEFRVDYFDIDPILMLSYDFDGERRTACLGIWENGAIKRIAEHPPILSRLAWWQGWFR